MLHGPLATLPLAAGSAAEVEPVPRRIEARVAREAERAEAERLWVGTGLLLGLRFREDEIDELLRGVGTMAEALKASST